MPTTVKCRGCGTNFKISGTGGQCPVCEKIYQEPKADDDKPKGKKPAAAKSAAPTKCPVCKKALTPGTKFCAACGTTIGTADVGDEFAAGMKLEEESAKNIARARFWRMFGW